MSATKSFLRKGLVAIAATLAIGSGGNALAWNGDAGQYEAVQPPAAGASPPSSSTPSNSTGNTGGRWTDLFAYPKGGQSTEQQVRDREECRKWAIEQSGFDPAQPAHDNANDWAAKRASYLRAEGACLQARNYSVK